MSGLCLDIALLGGTGWRAEIPRALRHGVELFVAEMAGDDGDRNGELARVLADGATRARTIAAETMKAVKDIVGFVRR